METTKGKCYNLTFFVGLFPVTYQTLGPTGLEKKKRERKGKGLDLGMVLLTLLSVFT